MTENEIYEIKDRLKELASNKGWCNGGRNIFNIWNSLNKPPIFTVDLTEQLFPYYFKLSGSYTGEKKYIFDKLNKWLIQHILVNCPEMIGNCEIAFFYEDKLVGNKEGFKYTFSKSVQFQNDTELYYNVLKYNL